MFYRKINKLENDEYDEYPDDYYLDLTIRKMHKNYDSYEMNSPLRSHIELCESKLIDKYW